MVYTLAQMRGHVRIGLARLTRQELGAALLDHLIERGLLVYAQEFMAFEAEAETAADGSEAYDLPSDFVARQTLRIGQDPLSKARWVDVEVFEDIIDSGSLTEGEYFATVDDATEQYRITPAPDNETLYFRYYNVPSLPVDVNGDTDPSGNLPGALELDAFIQTCRIAWLQYNDQLEAAQVQLERLRSFYGPDVMVRLKKRRPPKVWQARGRRLG